MSDTRAMASDEMSAELIGDATLEAFDRMTWNLREMVQAIGDEVGGPGFRGVAIRRMSATCGICEATPITWVAIERDGKLVRVARCAAHRPESDLMELTPVVRTMSDTRAVLERLRHDLWGHARAQREYARRCTAPALIEKNHGYADGLDRAARLVQDAIDRLEQGEQE